MMGIGAFMSGVAGLFVGSFLHVVADRIPRNESFLMGRSHCDFCNHTLSWYDLIPLLSFVLLGGKCRYCRKSIGWKYPLVEVTTALVYIATYLWIVQAAVSLVLALSVFGIVSALIVIFFADLWHGIIPDIILLFLAICSVGFVFLSHQLLGESIVSGLITGGFFLVLFLATSGKGMGFGDVKYALVMGFLLGFPFIIVGLYVAFLTGAIVALILILWYKKPLKGTKIPFGPFLVGATYVALLFGNVLWPWLISLLHL